MPNYISTAEAAALLPKSNRILVIGCSGGGKTTISVDLANRLGIEYQSIDRDVRWLPNWQQRDRETQKAILLELVSRDRWVMDGSGASTFDIRLPRADLILWVRVRRSVALKGLTTRVLRNFRTVRPQMADGCPEKLPDLEFLSYIWNFEKKHAPIFINKINQHGPDVPLAILESRSEISSLLDSAFKT